MAIGSSGAEALAIPRECFSAVDLNKSFEVDRRFDLAMSMEVAEHLVPESSANFVRSLTRLSDIVLFSAAVPGQGGTNHINFHPRQRPRLANFHELWGWQALEGGNVDTARKHARKSLIVAPPSMNAWKPFYCGLFVAIDTMLLVSSNPAGNFRESAR